MVWYSHPFKSFPQFVMIHTVKCFSIANETEVDVFLEFRSSISFVPLGNSFSFLSPIFLSAKVGNIPFLIRFLEPFKMEKSPSVYPIDGHQMFLSFPKVEVPEAPDKDYVFPERKTSSLSGASLDHRASLIAQLVKNPSMQVTLV